MGNELGESNIFFRAQLDYNGGNLEANALDIKHSASGLHNHILQGSNKAHKRNDPYISMTKAIETALLKYSYGINGKDEHGEYYFNKKRAKVLLINLPKQNACKTAEIVPEQTNAYFTTEVLLKAISIKKSACNYLKADDEVIAYRQIDEKYVHEVHPILADLLFALNVTGNTQAYNEIVNKIITGELSVEAVNEKFFGVGKCVGTGVGMNFNDVERIFLEKYYGERENIVDVYDQCFPSRFF